MKTVFVLTPFQLDESNLQLSPIAQEELTQQLTSITQEEELDQLLKAIAEKEENIERLKAETQRLTERTAEGLERLGGLIAQLERTQ